VLNPYGIQPEKAALLRDKKVLVKEREEQPIRQFMVVHPGYVRIGKNFRR
jgi:hypothetical protein